MINGNAKQRINELVVQFIEGQTTVQSIRGEIETSLQQEDLDSGGVILALIHAEKGGEKIIEQETLTGQSVLTDDQVKLIELVDALLVGVSSKANIVRVNGNPLLEQAPERRVNNLRNWIDNISQSNAGCAPGELSDRLIEMGDNVENISCGVRDEEDIYGFYAPPKGLKLPSCEIRDAFQSPPSPKSLPPIVSPFGEGEKVTVQDMLGKLVGDGTVVTPSGLEAMIGQVRVQFTQSALPSLYKVGQSYAFSIRQVSPANPAPV